jgi:hypothetical protein
MQIKTLITLLVCGLAPLHAARAEAQHGGASNHPAAKSPPSSGQHQELQIPQPVSPQPPRQGMQMLNFTPDTRCARLTEAQRRQTPGCN